MIIKTFEEYDKKNIDIIIPAATFKEDTIPLKRKEYLINCPQCLDGLKVYAIATTVYNDFSHLEETINSVLDQEAPNSPILYVIKDASRVPGCLEILSKCVMNHRPEVKSSIKVVYKHQPDTGMYDGLNEAFNEIERHNIKGNSVMTYINADDILHHDALKSVEEAIHETGAEWVTGKPHNIDISGKTISTVDHDIVFSSRDIAAGKHKGVKGYPFIQQEGTFWTLGLYRDSGRLDSRLKLAGDFELWTRFAQKSHLLTIQRPLASFRKRPGQKSEDIHRYYMELKNIEDNLTKAKKDHEDDKQYTNTERDYLEGFRYTKKTTSPMVEYVYYHFQANESRVITFSKISTHFNSEEMVGKSMLNIDTNLTPSSIHNIMMCNPQAVVDMLIENKIWLFNATIAAHILNKQPWNAEAYRNQTDFTKQLNLFFNIESGEQQALEVLLNIADSRLIAKRYLITHKPPRP